MTWTPPWAQRSAGLSGLHGLYGLSSRDWYGLAGLFALWSEGDETGLLALARQGDRNAFNKLFEHYRPQLVRVLRGWAYGSLSEKAQIAEEVANDTGVKAARYISGFRGYNAAGAPVRFSTWLTTIGRNLLRDKSRAAARLKARIAREQGAGERTQAMIAEEGRLLEDVGGRGASAEEAGVTFGPAESGPPPARSWQETVFARLLQNPDAMKRVIDSLTPIQREIFLLREVRNMSYTDISRQLGIPIGTVKYRIFSAREAVEESIAKIFGGTRPAVRPRRKP